MHQSALKAYDSVNKSTMSGRDVEASVLTKAAVALKKCQDNWTVASRDAELDAALKFNQRVWTIFQAELGNADNPMPQNLKLDLLRLSIFIDKRTLEMIANPSPEKLTVLININHNIAAGLRARPVDENAKAEVRLFP